MNAVLSEPHTLPPASKSLLVRIAERYHVDPDKMSATLKATAFRSKTEITNEQLMMLLVVADQYKLNPFTAELFAFPGERGLVPIVSVDGWIRIINERPELQSIAFDYASETSEDQWISCTITRKDRTTPLTVREYLAECRRETGPWKSHPRRMLRHKVLIQCARIAFGFGGLYDPDEGERIIEAAPRDLGPRPTEAVDLTIRDRWVAQITDTMALDKLEWEIAPLLRDIDEELNKFPEIYTSVLDYLAHNKIISKAKWREYLKILPPDDDRQIP